MIKLVSFVELSVQLRVIALVVGALATKVEGAAGVMMDTLTELLHVEAEVPFVLEFLHTKSLGQDRLPRGLMCLQLQNK